MFFTPAWPTFRPAEPQQFDSCGPSTHPVAPFSATCMDRIPVIRSMRSIHAAFFSHSAHSRGSHGSNRGHDSIHAVHLQRAFRIFVPIAWTECFTTPCTLIPVS